MHQTYEKVAEGVWLARSWYDKKRVCSETFVGERNGQPGHPVLGPSKTYDLDGNVVRELLMIRGQLLDRSEYEKASQSHPWLPAPACPTPTVESWKAFETARLHDPRYLEIERVESDRFCEERLAGAGVIELRQLAVRGTSAIVGELSPRKSKNLLKKLCDSRCKAVYAVEVEEEELEGNPVLALGGFVVELPAEREERRALRKLLGPWVRSEGFRLLPEMDQRYLYFSIK